MIEQIIIEYLQQQSRGVINLSLTHAKKIVDMVQGNGLINCAVAKLHRKNSQANTWENIRNIRTTEDEVRKQIIIALEVKPNMDFYMYECYNCEGLFEGRIYTFDQNLFD